MDSYGLAIAYPKQQQQQQQHITTYISVRRRDVSVCLSVGLSSQMSSHILFSMEMGYSGTVYWLHKIALYPESGFQLGFRFLAS